MPLITSAGVGSGLDLESIIKASVDAENRPKMQQFAIKDERLSVELSAIGEVKSALSTLNDTVEKLADIDNFNKRVANITQPTSGDIISVTPTSDISVGNFDIAVTQLAQGSRAVSTDGAFASADAVVSASGGTLTFAAGTNNFNLTVTAGMTLNELRDAINADDNNFGVTANIINTGDTGIGSKLVLTSSVTGSNNNLVITSDTAELDAIETHDATTNPTGGMVIADDDKAQDAKILVDGLVVTSETNTFKDAVQDMTITAKAKSVQDATTLEYETAKLNIDYDRESVNTLIDELITNYNAVIGQIGFRTRIGEPLNGDSSMRSLDDQLISALSKSLTDAGPFESIFDIGLGVDKEGYLEKSSLVRSINDAMDSNFDDIGTAFAGENGVAKELETLLGNYVDSSGLLKQREDSLNSQIKELEDDVIDHEYRMASLEDRLRKQYAGLDVLIAQMQQTQNYLGAQLANLPGFTKK
ncbi:flagellar filament capping protein FliD [Pseudoalteromonas luteoviolacea]|uniref:Flagellar hook-associated protein 2 n=1 Tax=Pseudoalteromonas luteoviolacea S4054 TaxID=1129367 RepID=A0A0F6A988_9GAMM|nr:flagellar filament capping protein FliD [Pseudoalteromonas luteoviolacea]AOT07446.1 flagellar cap protein [Pseudoalteromonas luteoviolacea]AOT12362.1 flagellar cap protein [Pseudoalteromonas luteoviolacea]AOT17275.1 flagellar cap protein [Pseudoalteromonas luteoviolacea]KKE81959.1 flagellar cap protein [Pseudoalteromonas luteoviolacea S4054]KZN74153.1 flagellar cap protein [Pseudoalteromonas luteoviolacea S4047-1]